MQDENIRKIVRYLSGECNPAEAREMISWKRKHPEEFAEIEKIYRFTPFESIQFEQMELKQLLGTDSSSGKSDFIKREKSTRLSIWLKIAASVIVLLSIGLATNYLIPTRQIITNDSTERRLVDLPDGSVVILDKVATLHFRTSLAGTFNRKVDLNGRAHFNIVRNETHPFAIHTINADIRVLGTKFTVAGFENRTQVILEEGKIVVTSKACDETIELMQPGEQVIFNTNSLVKHSVINNHLYMSWLTDKLEFENCSVNEALDFLSDTWDINVSLNDSLARITKLYGSAPSDDPELIIKAITLITNKEISIE